MVKDKKQSTLEYQYPLIAIGGALVVSLLLAIFIGRPVYSGMKKNSQELKEKKAVLAALETKLANLKVLKDQEAELKEKNEKVLAALPADKDVSRLFNQFESLAAASGVTIKKVAEASTTTTTGSELIKPVGYQVTADARDYNSFKNLLLKMNDALRLLSVSDLSVTKTEKMDVILNVSTYVRGVK